MTYMIYILYMHVPPPQAPTFLNRSLYSRSDKIWPDVLAYLPADGQRARPTNGQPYGQPRLTLDL